MFIVRSGRSWDNPKIEFVCEDLATAQFVVNLNQKDRYADHQKSCQMMIDMARERRELKEFRINRGTFDPENYYDETHETFEEQIARHEKNRDLPFEEWLETGKWSDWYYEEAPVIENWQEAEAIYRAKEV